MVAERVLSWSLFAVQTVITFAILILYLVWGFALLIGGTIAVADGVSPPDGFGAATTVMLAEAFLLAALWVVALIAVILGTTRRRPSWFWPAVGLAPCAATLLLPFVWHNPNLLKI
jgi:hypothetical protein